GAEKHPLVRFGRESGLPAVVIAGNYLAIDIELRLLPRAVSDAHRRRIFVAGQPGETAFEEPPLSADTVNDLHLLGFDSHRAQQPIVPAARLFGVAGQDESSQDQARVANPAITVVPV